MPQRLYDGVTKENLEKASQYRPGYDWIPGRFGPAPGIPEEQKRDLDNMNDKEYLYAFMRLSQEEKESLMISEAERRRTYSAHWPIQHMVRGNDLAKEGFYYTGIADKVQCAFCCGIIRNWEKGDNPAQSHRDYFSYCKMAQRKPCFNIPFDETDSCKALVAEQLALQEKTDSFNGCGVKYSSLQSRQDTFKDYPSSNPIPSVDLASAGFYYKGYPDIVKCFCCDGELMNWALGDDVWREHAKWYPGCAFVKDQKGVGFILQARTKMSKEDLEISQSLKYNCSDLSFLEYLEEENFDVKDVETNEDPDQLANGGRRAFLLTPGKPSNLPHDVEYMIKKESSQKAKEDSYMEKEKKIENCLQYKVLIRLGMDSNLLRRAYQLLEGGEFDNIQDLITLVEFFLEENEVSEEPMRMAREVANRDGLKSDCSSESSKKSERDLKELLRLDRDLSEEESGILVEAMTCDICKVCEVGAALLPCGHFCICESCSQGELPTNCPQCDSIVVETIRGYFNS